MDFHSLSRKELQTLCKKNKIPANITNVAMTDALAALPQVEGLDEFLNPTEADGVARTPDIHHHPRTATRRKGIKEELESNKVCSRVQRGSRAKKVEAEQDSNVKILPLPVTPAVIPPSNKRRALPISTRRKKEEKEEENDDGDGDGDYKNGVVLQTPAALPSGRSKANGLTPRGGTTSIQPSYSTRRSVRLLEKNLSKMSLLDNEDMESASIDHAISQGSTETQKVNDVGASLHTVSTVVSEETDELEVSSLEKNTEYEECQSHDLGSEIPLVSGAGLQADPQEEGLGKVNCFEDEPLDSNLVLDGISQTCDHSHEAGERCDNIVVDLKKPVAIVEAMLDAEEDNEAGSELLTSLEGFSEPENKDCHRTRQDAFSAEASEDAFEEFMEQDVDALSVEVPNDASLEVAEQCVGSVPMFSASADSTKLQELECFNEPEIKDCLGTKQDALSAEASEDAFMEFTEKDIAALSIAVSDDASLVVADPCVTGLVPISSAAGDSVKLEELVEGNTDNQGGNECGDNRVKNDETADGNHIQNFEPMLDADEKAADEKDLEAQTEQLEAQTEDSEEHAFDVSGASSAILAVKMDAAFENSNTVLDAENVTLESSLLDAGVFEAEDPMNNSEMWESKAQAEEFEELAEGEETALDAFPSILGGVSNPQIPEQISLKSTCNANTPELSLLAETVAVAPVHQQKISDIPIQSLVADQLKGESLFPAQSETRFFANEIHMHNANMIKENLTTVELHKKSIGELKKMLKNSTLDGKSKCKSKTDNVVKEVEKKRTALQVLPENRMTNMEAQNDG